MKIVTGVGENAHVTSKEFRRVIESMAGQGSFIIKCGDNMATDLVSNNLLKIKSGAMIHHGNISSVDPYDEIEINNGTQGMKRIDLVVNRYTKNAETEIESNEWVVIQGTPAASNPEVPAYTVGNLQDGDLVDDCPFCQIIIDGINVTEVKELLTIMPSIPELNNEVAELNSKIVAASYCGSTLVTTVANGVASVNVKFNNPFAADIKPKVVANIVSSLPDKHSVTISNISNTGFTINLYRSGSSIDIWVDWIVVANLSS